MDQQQQELYKKMNQQQELSPTRVEVTRTKYEVDLTPTKDDTTLNEGSRGPAVMRYNRLGNTGLLVSELAFGTWINFRKIGTADDNRSFQEKVDTLFGIMKCAYQLGINTFDTAEIYGHGDAEEMLSFALERGVRENIWGREDLVIMTKIFFGSLRAEDQQSGETFGQHGTHKKCNRCGLSRKHIVEGVNSSLTRLKIAYCDVVLAHRPDPVTPIEEVVRAFNFLIDKGLIFYWGTSEWSAQQIQEAFQIAEKLNLVPPCVDQTEYNLFHKKRVEEEYRPLYKHQLGITSYSPLMYGILSGKYKDGIPEGSRLTLDDFRNSKGMLEYAQKAEQLRPYADKLGCTMTQLAIAWCMRNKHVSTVILGASSEEQMTENLGALAVVDRITKEMKHELGNILRYEDEKPPSTVFEFRNHNLRHSKGLF